MLKFKRPRQEGFSWAHSTLSKFRGSRSDEGARYSYPCRKFGASLRRRQLGRVNSKPYETDLCGNFRKLHTEVHHSHSHTLPIPCTGSKDGCHVQSKSADERPKLLLQPSSNDCSSWHQGACILSVRRPRGTPAVPRPLTLLLDTLIMAVRPLRSPASTSPSLLETHDPHPATTSTPATPPRSSRSAAQPRLKMMPRSFYQSLVLPPTERL
jgi:hypothetical protein